MISVLSQRIDLSYGRPGSVQESGPSSFLRATQGGRTSRPICQIDPGGRPTHAPQRFDRELGSGSEGKQGELVTGFPRILTMVVVEHRASFASADEAEHEEASRLCGACQGGQELKSPSTRRIARVVDDR